MGTWKILFCLTDHKERNEPVELERISPFDPAWLRFIETRPDAMIFHHPFWMKNLEDTYDYKAFVLVVEGKDQTIQAGVPMMQVDSFLTGRRWVSLPFSDWCAPLFLHDEALEELTDGLIELSETNGVPGMELRWQYPVRPQITTTQDHVLHLGHFSKDTEAELLAQFRQKIRYCIRTSIERGIQITSGTSKKLLEIFYTLQCLTRKRHGLPVQPWKYFMNLRKNILEKGLGRIFLAYYGDDCVAGQIILHYRKTLTLKYAASARVDLTYLHPNHLIDWEGIKWGSANGYTLFDCGRSKTEYTGLRQYKNQWGYREMPLIYSYIKARPKEMGINIGFVNKVIRHSPVWLGRLAGELLYRHVG
ncbi:MAG: GNAT family N-acetyltransferase [Leptolinea sp.]|nr:GNAT family N-acetyltransferase [Leptolinea sp.]